MADTAKKTTLKDESDKLFASTSHQTLWGNPSGEFFTSENLGSLSLKKNEKLIKFDRPVKAGKSQEETLEETK